MMPAMMISEMPLPMPYSVICSPIHMRNSVPAVSASDRRELVEPGSAEQLGVDDARRAPLRSSGRDHEHRLDDAIGTVAQRVHWLMFRWPAWPSLDSASSGGTTLTSSEKMMLALM